MNIIYITVQGGEVQDVMNIPAGTEVVVIDYDVESMDRADVSPLDGEACCLTTYTRMEASP